LLPQQRIMKSVGHICFYNDYEYYERDGKVYRAHVTDPIDLDTQYRNGTYECTKVVFDSLKRMFLN
jgi:stress response protein YsnF